MYTALDGAMTLGAWRLVTQFTETPVIDAHREEFAYDTSARWKAVDVAYDSYRTVVHLNASVERSAHLTPDHLRPFAKDAVEAIHKALQELGHDDPDLLSRRLAEFQPDE